MIVNMESAIGELNEAAGVDGWVIAKSASMNKSPTYTCRLRGAVGFNESPVIAIAMAIEQDRKQARELDELDSYDEAEDKCMPPT